jgi:hypothetical protein
MNKAVILLLIASAVILFIVVEQSDAQAGSCRKSVISVMKVGLKAAKTNATTAKKAAKAAMKIKLKSIKKLQKTTLGAVKLQANKVKAKYCKAPLVGKTQAKCAKMYIAALTVVAKGSSQVHLLAAKCYFNLLKAQIKTYLTCQLMQLKAMGKSQEANCVATDGASSTTPYPFASLSLGCPPAASQGTTGVVASSSVGGSTAPAGSTVAAG